MTTPGDAAATGLAGVLIGLAALALVLVIMFVVSCEIQPDIKQLQEVLCERLGETVADYRDCLEEVQ